MKFLSSSETHNKLARGSSAKAGSRGFTLVEVLASSVIMLIAVAGSIVAFNLITQSVRGTGLRADQSRRIDSQIAEVSRLAEIYTSCGTPAGAVPPNPPTVATACAGGTANVQIGNSFYYTPDPANIVAVDDFYTACRSADPANHITANFMNAVDNLQAPNGAVLRLPSARVDEDDASNFLVEVTWTDPGNRVLRRFRISPLVSAWCP